METSAGRSQAIANDPGDQDDNDRLDRTWVYRDNRNDGERLWIMYGKQGSGDRDDWRDQPPSHNAL